VSHEWDGEQTVRVESRGDRRGLHPAGGGGLARGQAAYGPPVPDRPFAEDAIFLGIGREGEVGIALKLRGQLLSGDRLLLQGVLVPTAAFSFGSGYRGFQKVERVRIRKSEELRILYEGGAANFALTNRVELADTLPVAVEFRSRKRRRDFVANPIREVGFHIREIVRWEKVVRKDLPMWKHRFERAVLSAAGIAARRARRSTGRGVPARREAGPDDAEYMGRWATLNGTYIFEKKTVYSPIVGVLSVGEFVERTKPVAGGWMEVLYGEEEQKGYVPAVFLVDDEAAATRWETEKGLRPVPPPLQPAVSAGDTASAGAP